MGRRKLPKNIPVKLPEFKEEVLLTRAGQSEDWSHEFYRIKEIHDKGYRGKGVKIAVLDTGVELSHDAFKKAVNEGRLRAIDARIGGENPTDLNGHGSWCVSRFIGDDEEILGFCPDAEVISIKVLNDNGSGNLESVVKGYEIAIAEGVDIISTSLGLPYNVPELQVVVEKAEAANIIQVSAAGNDGSREDIDYPALYDVVLAIGSHDEKGERALHSDYGKDTDLYGSGIRVKGAWTRNRTAIIQGTSMATPSVGALIALFLRKVEITAGVIKREVLKKLATCL